MPSSRIYLFVILDSNLSSDSFHLCYFLALHFNPPLYRISLRALPCYGKTMPLVKIE